MASFNLRHLFLSLVRGAVGSVGLPQLGVLAVTLGIGGAAIAGPAFKDGGRDAHPANSSFPTVVLAKPSEANASQDHSGHAPVGGNVTGSSSSSGSASVTYSSTSTRGAAARKRSQTTAGHGAFDHGNQSGASKTGGSEVLARHKPPAAGPAGPQGLSRIHNSEPTRRVVIADSVVGV
jgi:hypothetical protein